MSKLIYPGMILLAVFWFVFTIAGCGARVPVDSSVGREVAADVAADVDADGDGLTAYVEGVMGTSDDNLDTDGDLLEDGYEVNTSRTDPRSEDTDYDGYPDYMELAQGSDPNDENDPLVTEQPPPVLLPPPPQEPVFIAGNTFSFLTQEETDALFNLVRATGGLHCYRDGMSRCEDFMYGSGFRDQCFENLACRCGREEAEAQIVGFESSLYYILDTIGYAMTLPNHEEVSWYMHDHYDSDDPCRVGNCTSVSSLCAW